MKLFSDSMYRSVVIVMLWTIYLATSVGNALRAIDIAMIVCLVIGILAGVISGRNA